MGTTSPTTIDRSKLGDITRLDGVQAVGPLAFSSATIVLPNGQKPLDVSLIGVEPGKPGEVPVRQGESFVSRRANEAVIDRNTALRTNLKVGDMVTLKAVQGTKEEFYPMTVVGISDGQQYSLRPSVFVPDLTWDKVRPRSGQLSDDITYNVVAVKLADPARTKELVQAIPQNVARVEAADLVTAYKKTPGYTEQQATPETQRIFTLIIGVLVVGGFFQIQMLQKVPQIGMLKAIGARNRTVAGAVILQVPLVTLIGVGIGTALTLLLAANFPVSVTFDLSGVSGVEPDLVVRPYGWKGFVPALRNFVLAAANAGLGMQGEEFAWRLPADRQPDADADGVARELSVGDITAMTIYNAAQETPHDWCYVARFDDPIRPRALRLPPGRA